MGFDIADGLRVFLYISFANGVRVEQQAPGNLALNVVYDWTYTYDPSANGGVGALTVTFTASGQPTLTKTYNLSAANRAAGGKYNAFGWIHRGLSSQPQAGVMYMDNLSYTALAPGVSQKTQNFDYSEEWARLDNWRSMGSRSYGHSVGWYASNDAGGTGGLGAGELNGVQTGSRAVNLLWYGDYFGPSNLLYYATNEMHMSGKWKHVTTVDNNNVFGPGWFYWDGTSTPFVPNGADNTPTPLGDMSGIYFRLSEGGNPTPGSLLDLKFPVGWPAMTVVSNFPAGSPNPTVNGMLTARLIETNYVFSLDYYPPGSTVDGNLYANGFVSFKLWGTYWNDDALIKSYKDYYQLDASLNSPPPAGRAANLVMLAGSSKGADTDGSVENIQNAIDDLSYTAVVGNSNLSCIVLVDAFAEGWEQLAPGFNGRVGQTNRNLTIVIPPEYNAGSDFYFTISSANPAIAQPLGAVGGTKTVKVATGADNTIFVPVEFLTAGTTTFTVANTNGACFAAGSNTVQVTAAAAVPAPQLTSTASQTFDSALAASGGGWSELSSRINGQNFGFSATANAGGSAGEAGGTFFTENLRAAYADVDAGTPLALNDYIAASGRLNITGWEPVDYPNDNESGSLAEFFIGHADSTKVGLATRANVLGIRVRFYNGVNFRPTFVVGNNTGNSVNLSRLTNNMVQVPPSAVAWSYTYDPNEGAWGNGRLTMTWSNDNSGWKRTRFIDLPYAFREVAGTRFDSFGLTSRRIAGETGWSTNFIDNVAYSVAASVKIVKIESLPGPQVKITFDSTGTNHRVDKRDAVATGSWSTQSGVTFGGSPGALTATFAKPVNTAQFYRVVIVP